MNTSEAKITSKKSTTMYEVDDSNLSKSYNIDSESRHYGPFYDFIRSLGFDAHPKYEGGGLEDHMMIDGEEFQINFDKSPYLAKNSYTRETKPRKDRCIEIFSKRDQLVAKIKFNEEIDRDKLIDKIQKAINEKKSWNQEIVDRKQNEIKILTTMRDHYYSDVVISTHVEYIMVHQGILEFSIDGATIKVDAKGAIKQFIPFEQGKDIQATDITKWASDKSDIASRAIKVCSALKGMKAVGKEFSEYAKGAYNRYVRKDIIEEI